MRVADFPTVDPDKPKGPQPMPADFTTGHVEQPVAKASTESTSTTLRP